MALDLHFQEQLAETVFDERCSTPLEKWKTVDDEPEDHLSGGFDCNICLDVVRDPVVTFCGHLYCWPCIYKWIQFQPISSEHSDHQKPQCPVCKAEISQNTLIPLYGPGQATKPSEDDVQCKGVVIPQRPLRPICGSHMTMETANSLPSQQLHHRHQPHSGGYAASPTMLSLGGTTTNVLHPMLGEVVYARMFGNAYPNSYNLAAATAGIRRNLAGKSPTNKQPLISFTSLRQHYLTGNTIKSPPQTSKPTLLTRSSSLSLAGEPKSPSFSDPKTPVKINSEQIQNQQQQPDTTIAPKPPQNHRTSPDQSPNPTQNSIETTPSPPLLHHSCNNPTPHKHTPKPPTTTRK